MEKEKMNLMVFEGKKVEIFEWNDKVLFNPRDVGNCLDISDVTVRRHLQEFNEKQVIKVTNSDVQRMNFRKLNNAGENFLTESGVYKLIFKSKKAEAERFQDWVTDEVLPQIRKTGGYIPIENDMSEKEILARALLITQKTIEEQKHKVLFADAVESSTTSILIRELAKILNQNGIDIGQQRLFEWLREKGYLIKKKGTDYNTPTQYSMDLKLMELTESVTTHSDGHITITRTPKITGKGQVYFLNKFLNSNYIKDKVC